MPVDNTIHIINFKVKQWNLPDTSTQASVFVEGVYEENVFI